MEIKKTPVKTLFISYNGALEPLVESQGIPYLEGLSQKGVRCVLLTFEKPLSDKKLFKIKILTLKTKLRSMNIEWFYLIYHKKPTVPATLFDIFSGIIVSTYIIVSRKIDIVHCRAAVAGIMGFISSRLTGKKLLLDERGLMAEEYVDGNIWKRGGLLYRFTAYIEKLLLRKADAVVVLTKNIRSFLLTSNYLYKTGEMNKKEITVIPCCVDLRKFNLNRNAPDEIKSRLEGKFVILYSGSLGTWYLLKEMIDFFKSARTVINNAHFLAVTPAQSPIINALWRENGLSPDNLTITSAAHADMPKLLRLADCGIFFINPVLSKRSSCPIKFAEYLASGLPVIINSGIGDTGSIVEENSVGAVIKEFTEQEYLSAVHKLEYLMKNRDLLENKCYNTAKLFFRLELGIEAYYGIYKKLTGIKQ